VYDLLAATGLIPDDRLAGSRNRRSPRSQLISKAIADATGELVEVGVIPGDRGARIFSRRSGLPLVDLALTGVDKEAAALFPLHVLDRYGAIAYEFVGDTVKVALANPFDLHGIDALRLATRNPLEFGVASRDEISVEIRKLLRQSESHGTSALADFEAEFKADGEEEDLTDLDAEDGISDAPLVRLVNSVFLQAAEDGASDIHFAPQSDSLIVRFRIDGVLHEMQEIPKRMTAGVVTRLKVLAKLDIAERRKPQDGRISLNAAAVGRSLDVRVATLPTVEGESVVMRLLDKSKTPPTRGARSFRGDARHAVRHRLAADRRAPRHRPDGLR
jgi:Type II secretory pathway, ATPase PulE/Tfp pilus assembly pathway, ATPase PilB